MNDTLNMEGIKRSVEDAVARLVREQPELLDLDVNELTISQQLARVLEPIVTEGLAVDVEYNRHGRDKKIVRLRDGTQTNSRVVRPDIVIHRRGTDAHNLLVLEVKKVGTSLVHDRSKLEALKNQYGYRCAAHIVVGIVAGQAHGEVLWIE